MKNLAKYLSLFFGILIPFIPSLFSSISFAVSPAPLGLKDYYSDFCRTNWIFYPCNKWTLQHVREIMYTTEVSRGTGPVLELPIKPKTIDNISFTNYKGKKMSVKDWLDTSETDGFIVLKNGKIAAEVYGNNMNRTSKHNVFSVTKSFVGIVANDLILKNNIDTNDKVTKYIPELKNSGFKNYSIDDLLNMNNNIEFSEEYVAENSNEHNHKPNFFDYHCAITDSCSNTPHSDLRSYLTSIKELEPPSKHENVFEYATPATDVLLWFTEALSKRKFQNLLSETIWSKIGAEFDGYLIVDRNGVPFGGAGLNISLRDAARFGQMILQEGSIQGTQIIPKEIVEELEEGGDRSFFARNQDDANFLPNGSYKNQWWIMGNPHNAFMAIGIFGQWIYIDPTSQVVAVKFSSLREPDTSENGVNAYRAMDAIAHKL